MLNFLVLFAFLLLLLAFVIFCQWGGKCKNCGSLRTEYSLSREYLDDEGRRWRETEFTDCNKCGYREARDIRLISRPPFTKYQ